MPFPYDPADLAALDRLANFYNGGDYDASTNPGGMGRGGHRVNFENALADAARVGAANAAAATAAGTSATTAGNSATAAAASAAKLIGSSASNVAIGAGSKAFVTQAGKFFAPGAFVMVYSAANPTVNYMTGQVTAYSGTDLTVDASVTKGSGTFADWVIAIAGAPGGPGLPGLTGPVGPTPDIMVTFSDGVTDSDPGNGLLKFNNALPGSTTQLFIDNLDRYGTSIAAWLDSFDDSTNTALRGTIKLVQVSDPTKYARFAVVGAVVDGTGYRKIPVAHVLSSGPFTNAAILAIDFVRTGDKGLDGDGAGDVIGPAVSTDNHVALFNGTTGKLLKSGGALAPVATSGNASDVSVTPTGSLGASSVQAALAELDDEKQPLSALLNSLAGLGVDANKLPYGSGPEAMSLTDLTEFARSLLDDPDAAALFETLGYGPAGAVIGSTYAEYKGAPALTAVIPLDASVPQVTEGTQVLVASRTPKSITNRFHVQFIGYGTVNAIDNLIAALFLNGGANAIRASYVTIPLANAVQVIVIDYEFVPGSLDPQTLSVRMGPSGAGNTATINGNVVAGVFFGAAAGVSLKIREIKA